MFNRFCLLYMLLVILQANADETVFYPSNRDKSKEQAIGYTKTDQSLSRYLAYRDVPSLIAQYVSGSKVLDYGTGTGISARFLQELGLDVTGVDISKEMLAEAINNCPDIPFYLSQNGSIPLSDASFDLVFSSLVLFEIGSEENILTYLKEALRLMKKDAVMIAVTGSQDMYTKDWFIFDTDYPENKNLKSGDLAKVYLHDADIEFTDYYWTEADYRRLFQEVGLHLIKIHYPLGKDTENYPWKDEKISSPFVILVAKQVP